MKDRRVSRRLRGPPGLLGHVLVNAPAAASVVRELVGKLPLWRQVMLLIVIADMALAVASSD